MFVGVNGKKRGETEKKLKKIRRNRRKERFLGGPNREKERFFSFWGDREKERFFSFFWGGDRGGAEKKKRFLNLNQTINIIIICKFISI